MTLCSSPREDAVSLTLEKVRVLRPEGFRRLSVACWRPCQVSQALLRPPVLCVHGLTRNGRDFDPLARHLAQNRAVYCPDILGRGLSDDLADPQGYANPAYAADLVPLMARLEALAGEGRETAGEGPGLDWIGTSMGGLIGMFLAAQPGSPIRRLVLNDVGAVVEGAALTRIQGYVGQSMTFASLGAVEQHLRRTHAGFGALSDADWQDLAAHATRSTPDGRLSLAYDPAIAEGMRALTGEAIELWGLWAAIRCPVLVIRGESSDLLRPETVSRMQATGPGCTVLEVPGAGHAPALRHPREIEAIAAFLEAP